MSALPERTRMFGFIKNFFTSKPAHDNGTAAPAQQPVAPTAKVPPQPMRAPLPQSRPPGGGIHQAPRPEAKLDSNGSAPAAANATVTLPLQIIVNSLPPELKTHVILARVGDATFSASLDKVIPQLS